jgi:hypothetical protein
MTLPYLIMPQEDPLAIFSQDRARQPLHVYELDTLWDKRPVILTRLLVNVAIAVDEPCRNQT